jgi:hypothetical protein
VLGDWIGGTATYYGEQYQYVEVRQLHPPTLEHQGIRIDIVPRPFS